MSCDKLAGIGRPEVSEASFFMAQAGPPARYEGVRATASTQGIGLWFEGVVLIGPLRRASPPARLRMANNLAGTELAAALRLTSPPVELADCEAYEPLHPSAVVLVIGQQIPPLLFDAFCQSPVLPLTAETAGDRPQTSGRLAQP